MGFREMEYRIKGYLTIQAEGVFLERFLNICMRRDLHIRNVHRLGAERLLCDLSIPSFRKLRPVCFRTQTRVRILKRQGLPFLLHRYRKRKFVLIGIVLAILLLWYTSGHIMGITVFGNEKIPTETILHYLARSGVTLGNSAQNLNASHIRNQMMRDLDDLAWIGINISGSRVYVEVVERITPESRIEKETPCHLVASRDGVVTSLTVKDGMTRVSKGSGVRQGDVLVSGILDNTVEGYRTVHAYGEVYARTIYRTEQEYPLTVLEAKDTGNTKTRYTLRLLNRNFPLFFTKKAPYLHYEHTKTEKEFRLPIDVLPSLFLINEEFREQQQLEKTRTVAEVLTLAERELNQKLKKELGTTAKVESRDLSHSLTERGTVQVMLTLVCSENIAEEVPIQQE